MAETIIFSLILHLLFSVISCQQFMPSCTCQRKPKFGDCTIKDPELVWQEHYSKEVGLYGDCLPKVEENTMKCFRWRLAAECGPELTLKCGVRARAELDRTILIEQSSATFRSPGFYRRNPAYYNRNLCIYNISLNCPAGEIVELVPFINHTTTLSDAHNCRDYLSFHMDSQRESLMKLCGADIRDATKYKVIPSTSFYAMLWSNDNKADQGRFEIVARCKKTSELRGSGVGMLTPEDTITMLFGMK